MIEVIDHLLSAPEAPATIALVQPNVLYEFADPALEAQSAGRKLLVRMGPGNAARVKAKLKEIRDRIATRVSEPGPSRSRISGSSASRISAASPRRLCCLPFSHQTAPVPMRHEDSCPSTSRAAVSPSVGWWPTTRTVRSPSGHPASREKSCDVASRRERLDRFEGAAEGKRGFLGAPCRRDDHPQVRRQSWCEPARHHLGLRTAAIRERPRRVGFA